MISDGEGIVWGDHTIDAGVVGLDEDLLDFAVFNFQGVALAPPVPKDRRAVEAKVERLGEPARWVTQESDLDIVRSLSCSKGKDGTNGHVHRSCP